MDNIYKKAVQLVYENSGDWFEESYTLEDIEEVFINPLKPNIMENTLELKTTFMENNVIVNTTSNEISNIKR